MKSNKITILFDAGPLVNGQRTGIGQYTYRLIDTLAPDLPDNFELVGFYFNFLGRKHPELPNHPNIRYKSIRLYPGRVYNMLFRLGIRLPIDLLLHEKADIVLFPNFTLWPVLNRRTKSIVLIHDLSFIHFPEFASPINRSDMVRFAPRSAAKADRIITISDNSKKELVDYYHVNPDKIAVIAPAVNHSEYYRRSSVNIAKVTKKFTIPGEYILYTGTFEPRKNIDGIIEAYINLGAEIKNKFSLVLAGSGGWKNEAIYSAIENARAAGEKIITTGYVSDVDMPALYSGAAVFVFPSFYEGFGMPPLEAMACGVPVITSDNSSLPEVVRSAGITIEAQDTQALTKAMAGVLTDKKLAARMSQAGLKQSQNFSWEKSAEELQKIFEELAK